MTWASPEPLISTSAARSFEVAGFAGARAVDRHASQPGGFTVQLDVAGAFHDDVDRRGLEMAHAEPRPNRAGRWIERARRQGVPCGCCRSLRPSRSAPGSWPRVCRPRPSWTRCCRRCGLKPRCRMPSCAHGGFDQRQEVVFRVDDQTLGVALGDDHIAGPVQDRRPWNPMTGARFTDDVTRATVSGGSSPSGNSWPVRSRRGPECKNGKDWMDFMVWMVSIDENTGFSSDRTSQKNLLCLEVTNGKVMFYKIFTCGCSDLARNTKVDQTVIWSKSPGPAL